jgi:hypothetical protein
MVTTAHCTSLSITATYDQTTAVTGLRVFGRQRPFLFDRYRRNGRLDGVLLVGRTRECDLRIRGRFVSRRHCTVEETEAHTYLLWDLSSKNGVYVRGPGERYHAVPVVLLRVGLHIRIGDAEMVVLGGKQRLPITASTIGSFMRQALRLYGSRRAAARGVRLPRRLLSKIMIATHRSER